MTRFARWMLFVSFALFLLLGLGTTVAVGGPNAGLTAKAPSRAEPSVASAKKRYTLTVTFTAEHLWEAYAAGQLGGRIERTTTWTAKSVKPFMIERRGTRAKPAYRFVARVAGRLEHKGEGWVGIGGAIRCQLYGTDSRPQGIMVRATIKTLRSVSGRNYTLLIRPTRPKPKVVFTTEATNCGPQAIPSTSMDMSWGFTPPRIWNDRKYSKSGGQPQRAIKFGRTFTLKRFADQAVDPSLHTETAQTMTDIMLKWTLTFKPLRGR